ncbi:hypothetical protein E2N92_10215 [Methanofollis formosanus]|uniref:Uncharacterized protein n=1 Tax=Methanofollis formosanus TaxID=299308 RepID=A0A8G1A241_9EURY|nr:hypothetical protein [Methanofollis formosanus]QYZ79777.1 hypothetical protein E2N92_10215 [Methanofollis formosanus]
MHLSYGNGRFCLLALSMHMHMHANTCIYKCGERSFLWVQGTPLPQEVNENMADKKMTSEAASRIQAHADRAGKNQDFKARAQAAGEKNSRK